YGDAGGEIDESHPCHPVNAYGRSKLETEAVCRELGVADGLEVVILRPSIVYGPFSRWWTERFADRLLSGRWGLYKGYGEGLCNLIYVDDLVAAIWRAVRIPAAAGQTFNVNGTERVTWNRYVGALNTGLGLPPLPVVDPRQIKLRSLLLAPLRKAAEIGMAHFGPLVFKVYERFGFTRGLLRGAEKSLRTTPAAQELELYSRTGHYLAGKATEVLGWQPRIDLERGVELSCAWLRHHGYGV
ncbi:MAG: NAD-dependent epimerase/dehydratase family protein, partial [Thermoanaerobaculia bacterium]|nr:NAD-dependent epimerase/dehydratase family protein [Thermoanaerobaculia bacterium]